MLSMQPLNEITKEPGTGRKQPQLILLAGQTYQPSTSMASLVIVIVLHVGKFWVQ